MSLPGPGSPLAAPGCGPTSRAPPGSGSASSCTPPRRPGSDSSSATADPRGRPSSCGRAWTSRCPTGTGRWSRPRACPTRRASTRPRRRWTARAWTRWSRDFVSAARRGAAAGFDLLELHCAHGYLLSAFLSPVTNRRTDDYGGDVTGRLRFPLEVFAAVREVWPADRPMTVRISATDWVRGRGHPRGHPGGGTRVRGGGGSSHRRLHRSGHARRAAGVRAVLPDAVRRRDPQQPAHPDDRGRRDLLGRRREHDRALRTRRSLCPGPGPPLRPQLDPPRRARPGLRRARCAVAVAVAPGPPQAADRPVRRAEAATGADPVPGRERRTPAVARARQTHDQRGAEVRRLHRRRDRRQPRGRRARCRDR